MELDGRLGDRLPGLELLLGAQALAVSARLDFGGFG
jgi:hypothetical protein